MPPLAYFGIESSGLNLAIDLLILFVVVLYLSLIYWTYSDARRRIEDPMLVGCSTAASLFPFVGTIIYIVLRPPEYLEDVRERDLEVQAAEARLHELDVRLCPHCDYRVERDFIRCPSCLRKLKERCVSCSRPLDPTWTICPYCEAEVPGMSTSRRARRRRVAPLEGEREELGGSSSARAAEELGGGALGRTDSRTLAPEPTADGDDDLRAPVAASEPARAPRTGRAPRPGGRPRPTS